MNVALFALSVALVRSAGGLRQALHADAAALRARPRAIGATVVALALAVALLSTAYPHDWQPKRPDAMQWNEGDASQIPLPVTRP